MNIRSIVGVACAAVAAKGGAALNAAAIQVESELVCFWHKADIPTRSINVRFRG